MSSAPVVPVSFGVACEHYKVMSRWLMKSLRHPDGDLQPTLFVETERGSLLLGLNCHTLNSQAAKEHLFGHVLPRVLVRERARMCGLVVPAWRLKPSSELSQEDVSEYCYSGKHIAHHPLREEVISVTACDGDRTEMFQAVVTRRPRQRPRLGPWQSCADLLGAAGAASASGAFELEGLLVTSLRAALREVASER